MSCWSFIRTGCPKCGQYLLREEFFISGDGWVKDQCNSCGYENFVEYASNYPFGLVKKGDIPEWEFEGPTP